jgi:diguanylate cyclase (GGDEF)-like protein
MARKNAAQTARRTAFQSGRLGGDDDWVGSLHADKAPIVAFTLRVLDATSLEELSDIVAFELVETFGARAARIAQGRRICAEHREFANDAEVWRFPLTPAAAPYPLVVELTLDRDEDLLLLRQQYVDLIAIARRAAQKLLAFETERKLAREDSLTGLANRRTTEEELSRELQRCADGKGVVSVLVIDLDRFKEVNDTLGHNVGDQVLRAVGDCLRGQVRRSDTAGRWGGDEFVVILPRTEAGHALDISQRIRHAFSEDPRSLQVTMSIGIADSRTHPLNPNDGRAGVALIEAADRSLYTSKKLGRNRATLVGAA